MAKVRLRRGRIFSANSALPNLGILPVFPLRDPPQLPRPGRLGRKTYDKQCQACHGPEGDGEGEAAYLLYPRPRDLTSGEFRLVSTWDSVPTDEDLFGAISRGMPCSAMPSWSHLPEKTRWGLVHYVKTLSRRPLDAAPAQEPNASGDGGAGLLTVPPEPELTPEASARPGTFLKKAAPRATVTPGGATGSRSRSTPAATPPAPGT